MYACVYVCMYACLHTCRVLVLILSAPIVAAKMPSAVKRKIGKKRWKSFASYLDRVRRHKMIDLFWRRVRAEARCIPVDFDLMEVLTRGNGLTRTELRLVDSQEKLQIMFAKLQTMLGRFRPGDGTASLRAPISSREQEAVLEVVQRAALVAAAQAASVLSLEWPTEPQPESVSLDQSTELQRQLGSVSPERSTELQPEPFPERERQPGSNSAELLDADEFGPDSPAPQSDTGSPDRQPGSNRRLRPLLQHQEGSPGNGVYGSHEGPTKETTSRNIERS